MAKRVPVDPVAFGQDFERMFGVATSSGTAYFNERSWPGPRAPYEIWQEETPPSAEPYPAGPYMTARYRVWSLEAPDDRQTVEQSKDHRGRPTITPGHVYALTPFLAISAFARYAPDGQRLVQVSDALVAYLNRESVHADVHQMRSTMGHLIGRSLLLGPGPDGAYATEEGRIGRFPASLAELRPGRSRELAAGHIAAHLANVLHPPIRGSDIGAINQAGKKVDPLFTMQAVGEMEGVQFIAPDFWWKSGVENGLIFRRGDIGLAALKRLDASLVAHGEATLAEVPAENLQITMRRYIDNILASYMTDPNRDSSKLHTVIEALATERSTKMGRGLTDLTVDMKLLISLSNGFAIGINSNLRDAGVDDPDLQLPALDRTQLANVPQALLRILYATVRPDADPERMADMFEQDSMHVNVLDAVRQRLRQRLTASSPGDIRLRYPGALPAEVPTLMGSVFDANPSHETRTWRRARQRAARGASGYGLFSSGGAAS